MTLILLTSLLAGTLRDFDCSSQQGLRFQQYIAPEIFVCDKDIEVYIPFALDYWKAHGHTLNFDKSKKCLGKVAGNPGYGEIIIRLDQKKIEEVEEKANLSIAAYTTVYSSNIDSFSIYGAEVTFGENDVIHDENSLNVIDLNYLTMTHEIGHALGYLHVDKGCVGHIMNPYLYYVGLSFK